MIVTETDNSSSVTANKPMKSSTSKEIAALEREMEKASELSIGLLVDEDDNDDITDDFKHLDSAFESMSNYADELIDSILMDSERNESKRRQSRRESKRRESLAKEVESRDLEFDDNGDDDVLLRGNGRRSISGYDDYNDINPADNSMSVDDIIHDDDDDENTLEDEMLRLNMVSEELRLDLDAQDLGSMKNVLERLASEDEETEKDSYSVLTDNTRSIFSVDNRPTDVYLYHHPSPEDLNKAANHPAPASEGQDLNLALVALNMFVWFLVSRFLIHSNYTMLDEEGRMIFAL